jgi:4-amino-4-deoxy-L-arabinose transferase-like glycosyltransferase
MEKTTKRNAVLVVVVLIVAILLRGLYLGQIPPGIHPDAAANALDAWRVFTTHHHQVFYEANFGREGLFINLVSYSFQLFGPTIVAYKLPGILIGLFSVLGMYVLGTITGRRRSLGLFAAFFMAISFWMILFERTGLRATVSVSCVIWTSAFFLLALRQRRWYWYTLTGLFLGLGLNTYISFRLMPVILLVGFLYHVWLQRKIAQVPMPVTLHNHRGIIWSVLVAAVVVLPLTIFFFHHPEYIMGRANEVSVFNQPHSLELLARSTIANLSIFSFYGDPNWRHNIATQPLLDPLQSVLFLSGILIVWRQVRRIRKSYNIEGINDATAGVYLLILLVCMIIPAAITYSPGGIPHALRIINTAPAVYVLIAYAASAVFEWCWQKFINQRRQIILVTGAILIFMTSLTTVNYFSSRWGQNKQVAHEYSQDYTNLSAYINKYARAGNRVYLVNTSSEVAFFTVTTPNLLQSSSLQLSDVSSFHPSIIVVTTSQSSDQKYINDLRQQNWSDVGNLNLGEGGHSIIVLRNQQ